MKLEVLETCKVLRIYNPNCNDKLGGSSLFGKFSSWANGISLEDSWGIFRNVSSNPHRQEVMWNWPGESTPDSMYQLRNMGQRKNHVLPVSLGLDTGSDIPLA